MGKKRRNDNRQKKILTKKNTGRLFIELLPFSNSLGFFHLFCFFLPRGLAKKLMELGDEFKKSDLTVPLEVNS